MLSLAGHLFGCLFWGLVIALILTAICIFIAKGISNKAPNLVVAAVLLVFLAWQTVLGVGSLFARSYVEDVRQFIEDAVTYVPASGTTAEMTETLSDNFPAIPEKIIRTMSQASEGAASVKDMADNIAASLKKSLTSYLWERVAWAVGFMIVGIIALVKFPGSSGSRGGSRRGYKSTVVRDRYADLDY